MAIFAANGALDATFKITRALQVASMVAIIGLSSNFIAQMISAEVTPPNILIAVLSIICIATLYATVTFILYVDNLLPFLYTTILDTCLLVIIAVLSIIIGKPLSYLDCNVLDRTGSASYLYSGSSAYSFSKALDASSSSSSLREVESSVTTDASTAAHTVVVKFENWIASGKATCLEMKSIWGLCIALCILFFLSSVLSLCMWKRNKAAVAALAEKGEA